MKYIVCHSTGHVNFPKVFHVSYTHTSCQKHLLLCSANYSTQKLPPVSKCSQNDRVFHFTYLVSVLHCWALRKFWINKYVPKIKQWIFLVYLLICSYPTISVKKKKKFSFLCIIYIYISAQMFAQGFVSYPYFNTLRKMDS